MLKDLKSERNLKTLALLLDGLQGAINIVPEADFLHSAASGGVTIQPSDFLHFPDPTSHTLLKLIQEV